MKKVDIVINGRGLDLPMNGIPRYMSETLSYLDTHLKETSLTVEVVIPRGTVVKKEYQNIKIITLKKSILWDYLIAESYARKNNALYINLASKGTLYRYSICTIHDIRILREKAHVTYKDIKNLFKIKISYRLAIMNAKTIVTVSQFSKKELVEYFSISPSKVQVIGNGWEHLKDIQEDNTIFQEYPEIEKGAYFFSLGSIAPHKNFKWIIENKKRYPRVQYVVMGKVDTRIWKDTTSELDNIIYVGYQSDGRMISLMKNARALVFPSVYEGFGIPPLEALACGIPAMVADIPVMREIFGKTVYYFDEYDYTIDLQKKMNEDIIEDSTEVLAEYSWQKSAKKWLDLIESEIQMK